MALVFGGATSDRVETNPSSSINNLAAFTWVAWVFCTTRSSTRAIMGKVTQKRWRLSGTSGQLELLVQRATTNTSYITNDNPLATNVWKLLATTFDQNAGSGEIVGIYHGGSSPSMPVVESGYSSAVDGSGAPNSDAASGIIIGNISTAGTAFQGRIGFTAAFNRVLSLSDLLKIQRMFMQGSRITPSPDVVPGCVLWMLPGYHDHTTPQIDYSGWGNHGTVTGATRVTDNGLLRLPGYQLRKRIWIPVVAAGSTLSPHLLAGD